MLGHHFSAFLLVLATISDLLPHHASLFSHHPATISSLCPHHVSLFSHHPATISVCPLVALLLLSPSSCAPRLVYASIQFLTMCSQACVCPIQSLITCFPGLRMPYSVAPHAPPYGPTFPPYALVYIGPPVLTSPPVNPWFA